MAETPFRPLNAIAGIDPSTPVTCVKFDPHHEFVWTANENVTRHTFERGEGARLSMVALY